MSSMELSTPDYGRLGGYSNLDFMFWAFRNVQTSLPRSVATTAFAGPLSEQTNMMQLVTLCAAQTGIALPTDLAYLKSWIAEMETYVDPLYALHTRGALLFKNNGMAISVGDKGRVIESVQNTYQTRYLNAEEKVTGFWDSAATIPGMVIL